MKSTRAPDFQTVTEKERLDDIPDLIGPIVPVNDGIQQCLTYCISRNLFGSRVLHGINVEGNRHGVDDNGHRIVNHILYRSVELSGTCSKESEGT